MTTREKFKRRVIELIHGLPYKEAKEEEGFIETKGIFGKSKIYTINPITIGRVMQALSVLKKHENEIVFNSNGQLEYRKNFPYLIEYLCSWKLVKENGEERIDDDQSDETIKKLYELIKEQ